MQSKIKKYSEQKVPYIIVVGNKEKENNSIAIRIFSADGQKIINVNEFIKKMNEKIKDKSLNFKLD
jgi:threonyl-tRNA synthetase